MRPFRRVFSFGRQYGRSIQLETPQKAFAPRSARDGYSWRRTWPFIVGAVAAVSSVSAVFADNREDEPQSRPSRFLRKFWPKSSKGAEDEGEEGSGKEGSAEHVFASAGDAAVATQERLRQALRKRGVFPFPSDALGIQGIDGRHSKAIEFQLGLQGSERGLLEIISKTLKMEITNETMFAGVHEYTLEGEDPRLSVVVTVQGGGSGGFSDLFRDFDSMLRSPFGSLSSGIEMMFGKSAVVSIRKREAAFRLDDVERICDLYEAAVFPPSSSGDTDYSPAGSQNGNYDVEYEVMGDNGERIKVFQSSRRFGSNNDEYHRQSLPGTTSSNAGLDATQQNLQAIKQSLENAGATVFLPSYGKRKENRWDELAGYDDAKEQLRTTVGLVISNADILMAVARATRGPAAKQELERGTAATSKTKSGKGDHDEDSDTGLSTSILPRAILLTGPPGTGKTTAAKILADELRVPMVLVPLESIVSKWYGETEKNLAGLLDGCRSLGQAVAAEEETRQESRPTGGVIVFIDELDALAVNREDEPHEASRRMLSVLLRQVDGLESRETKQGQSVGHSGHVVLLGATNRASDLDRALVNRFDTTIHFGLPSKEVRSLIFAHYASHMPEKEVETLAEAAEGLSGRDIRHLCTMAERTWAVSLVKEREKTGKLPNDLRPPLSAYLNALQMRLQAKSQSEKHPSGRTMFSLPTINSL